MGLSISTLGRARGRMVGVRPALLVASLVSAALALASCASPAVRECGATGVLCPEGTHCAAAEGICIPDTNTCGDAHLDDGEVCDDGNTKDGDGCSHDCKSDESCGNNIIDLTARIPEVCDDGNTSDGDKCSHDCLSKETCGNGITDIGEECDDGNQEKGDLCSPQCRKEQCGNGILDPGEACDLLPVDTTRCSEDCKSSRMCGNAIVDPGEECDLGTNNNKDNGDCRSDCVINRCGDGFQNTEGSDGHLEHVEACDDAPPADKFSRDVKSAESPTCNTDCSAPSCGDGIINRQYAPTGLGPEQCDNGKNAGGTSLNQDNADCTAACQVNVCGDSKYNTAGPLHIEGCDDGNRNDLDTCTNACIAKACGDGIVGPGEECDLGPGNANNDNGACLSTCKLAKCGDGKVRTGVEECDGGANCSATCKTQTCGNGIIDPNEECDLGAANNNGGDCRTDCILNRCGDGLVNSMGAKKEACDGAPPVASGSHTVTPTETADCNINCTAPACGDKIVNLHFTPKTTGGQPGPGTEQCDDGTRVDGDGCTQNCRFELCGNGIVDAGEQCDGTAGCSASCFKQECNNGILDPGEECDLGSVAANGATGACPACKIAKCGDGKIRTGIEECDGGANCSATCKKQECGNGIIDPNEECDLGAANDDHGDCRADCVLNRCGDGHANSLGSHPEACDGATAQPAGSHTVTPTDTATCNKDCTSASCGDNRINKAVKPDGTHGEQCDDGAKVDGDGCSKDCLFEHCGNGIKDDGEACDDGNNVNGDACDNNCTLPVCGNGEKSPTEACDDGNGVDFDGCDHNCTLSATCGNGVVDSGELCDDGNLTCGACNATCNGITSAQAQGVILTAGEAAFTNPTGNTLVIGDGATTRTFELTKTTASGTNIPVLLATGDSATDVATKLMAAIAGSGLQLTTTRVVDAIVLQNKRSAKLGNVAIVQSFTVAGFASYGMTGGDGGDCAKDQKCTQASDCTSNSCLNGKCT